MAELAGCAAVLAASSCVSIFNPWYYTKYYGQNGCPCFPQRHSGLCSCNWGWDAEGDAEVSALPGNKEGLGSQMVETADRQQRMAEADFLQAQGGVEEAAAAAEVHKGLPQPPPDPVKVPKAHRNQYKGTRPMSADSSVSDGSRELEHEADDASGSTRPSIEQKLIAKLHKHRAARGIKEEQADDQRTTFSDEDGKQSLDVPPMKL